MYCDILRYARYEAVKPTDYKSTQNFAGIRFESRSGKDLFSDLGLPQESSLTPRNNPVHDFLPRALHSQTGVYNSPEICYSVYETYKFYITIKQNKKQRISLQKYERITEMKDTKRTTNEQDFCDLRGRVCSCQAGVCFLRKQYQINFLRLSESPHPLLTYAVFHFLKYSFNESKTCEGHETVIRSLTLMSR